MNSLHMESLLFYILPFSKKIASIIGFVFRGVLIF